MFDGDAGMLEHAGIPETSWSPTQSVPGKEHWVVSMGERVESMSERIERVSGECE
jgi:hypothetical protein